MSFLKKYIVTLLLVIISSNCAILNKKNIKKVSYLTNFVPKIIWKNSVGNGIDDFYSNLHPNYQKNILFVANRYGTIKALDINNGQEKWSIDLVKNKYSLFKRKTNLVLLSGGISVNDNLIFIGSETSKVYAINNINGKIVWKTKVIGEVISNLVIYKNYLFIHTSNGKLQCLNKNNGMIKWTKNLSILDKLSIRGESAPVIILGKVIIGDDNGRISALNVKTGKIIWQNNISYIENKFNELNNINDIDITPIIFHNKIYVLSYNGNLACLDVKSGNILWKKNIGTGITKNISLHNHYIYAVDKNDKIIAIDINNCKILWKQNNLFNLKFTSPIIYNDYLIVGDNKGYLHWINLKDGQFIGKQYIDSSGFQSDFLVAKNKLFIQSKNGVIYAIINHL